MTGDSHYILRKATPAELEQARQGHSSSWAGGLSGKPCPNFSRYLKSFVQLAEDDLSSGAIYWP